MTISEDLNGATEKTLDYVIGQAQLRIEAQNSFATAADQRASTITGMSVALAAAALGLAGQAYTTLGWGAFTFAALVAAACFSLAAHFAVQSARCVDFHPVGYRPIDFIVDIQARKTLPQIKREISEDYNERLEFNRKVLVDRGRHAERAILTLWLSPIFAGGAFLGWIVAGT